MNLFHHSSAFIAKHKRHHHLALATLALIIASAGVYTYRHEFAQAATFSFTQTSWAGGASATPAMHLRGDNGSDQTGWTYSSSTPATTIIIDGNGYPILPSASYSFTDDSATSSTSGITSGGGFLSSGVATSSTVVSAVSVGLVPPTFIATGGTGSCTSGTYPDCTPGASNYTYHRFTASSTFQVSLGTSNVDVLVVGGGGGGGRSTGGSSGYSAGGGGGGGVVYQLSRAVTAGSYNVVIGAGGTNLGGAGGSSSFGTITAVGGGGGVSNSTTNTIGTNGGASSQSDSGGGTGSGTFAGAAGGTSGGFSIGGGGGGSGAVGSTFNGGNGMQSNVTGTNIYYAGGGGAYHYAVGGGVGGLGGGASPGGCGTGVAGTANTGGGGSGACQTSSTIKNGGVGGSGVVIIRYLSPVTAPLSGTFTSATIDLGAMANLSSLAFASTTPSQTQTSCTASTGAGCALKLQIATNNDNATWSYIGPDGTASTYFTVSAGEATHSSLNGNRYVRYKAYLATLNTVYTPTLDSVTVNYSQYAGSGNLTSSIYDIGSDAVVSKITWAGATTSTEWIKFQVRSSADGITWSGWCGYDETGTTCDGSKYFYDSPTTPLGNGVTLGTSHPLRCSTANATCPAGGTADRYFQYKVFLTSGGDITPTLTSVTLQYVVNAAPIAGNVVTSGQISDSADANYGKVTFTYDVSDIDTVGGATPNKVTPTLYEYYNGTSWTTIPSGDLSSNAFTYISLTGNGATSTSPTIVWTPPASIATANAKIRATVTDGENANFSGVGTSGVFTLDTTAPTISATSIDSSGVPDVVTFTATDSSALSYRLCNTSCVSEAWIAGISSDVANHIDYTLAGAPNAETVYIQARDAYGNLSAIASVTAPATPGSFLVADVSNPGAGTYGESLSWIAPSGATSYNIYYATTSASTVAPTAYAPLPGAMGISSNVYAHTISPSASSSAYWYKVSAIGNGNTSNFATMTAGDVPDSFGTALSDTTAPTILSVATSSVLSTSAVVTVTTNELSSIQIFYSPAGYVPGCLYTAHTQPSAVYSTSTVVTLTGLANSTTYNFCVKATDVAGNPSLGTASIENSSFTTVSGPTISNVTLQNLAGNSVTIMWNTATSSDSYVHYSTSPSLANPVAVGSTTMVPESVTPGMFQHQVGLSGLTAGTTYYYKIKSTDGDGNSVTDPSDGTYRNLITLSDTTAPSLVGEITTPVKSSTAIVIVWQTDEPATSQVRWGLASTTLDRITELDSTKSIYHVVTLSSATNNIGAANNVGVGSKNELSAATPYFYTVESSDLAAPPENMMTSPVQTVTTAVDGAATISYVYVRSSSGDATLDILPPAISNVAVSDITPFGATVKFGTSEDAATFVDYGKDTLYGQSEGDKVFSTTHTVKLHGLTLGTDYHIKVSAIDKAGNTGTSADQAFKTTFLSENLKDMANVENIEQFQKEIESAIESILPSLVPPFVTKPTISDITESGATISFKTNIKAFPVVVYAEDGAYDETKDNPYTGEVSDTTEKATSHELALTGLKGNTKYHVQARAFSLPKVIGKSGDVTFITKASKIAGSIVERKKDSFTVVWTTEEPTTSIVEFKDLRRGVTERKVDEAKKTSHSMKVENLPSGTAYEVNLSGLTEQGNIAEAGSPLSVTTSTDTTPPGISGFKVDNALVPGRTDRIQTIVSWITDEPANSTVYYEEGAGTAGDTSELANKNEVLDSFVTGHSVILPSLKPGTIYRLKVTSSDDSGNLGSFGPRTVITPQQTASITDIIFKNFEDSFKFLRKI